MRGTERGGEEREGVGEYERGIQSEGEVEREGITVSERQGI